MVWFYNNVYNGTRRSLTDLTLKELLMGAISVASVKKCARLKGNNSFHFN